ncbi:MAG TPA: hypothetical protein PLL30_01825 [Candidatus Krumholzibacteria bacterium]|nr:hypothetical protein [Candidatus Krumholzibacteria bacterium]HPD70504.1 hypothetical protein [Candidatus Krumholzibacteria bacterium]HRY39796.1 hypothetical protein [Candidatus Krumholzibacteria bacterium]
MKIVAQNPALLAATRPEKAGPVGDRDGGERVCQPGRRHVQRGLKHLSRDIRHQVRDEIKELRATGADAQEKIQAVRELNRAFHQELQDLFHAAGSGDTIDAATIAEGLRQAMIDFTAALRELNGSPTQDKVEDPETPILDETPPAGEPSAPGALLDVAV